MSGLFNACEYRMPRSPWASLKVVSLIVLLCIAAGTAYADAQRPEGWYRLRTNSVPYRPQNVAVDSSGGIWVTSADGVEYDPGVWYRPTTPPESPFKYLTNAIRNNFPTDSSNPPIVAPQLSASVLDAVRDKAGNTWYALMNRTVLCEKPDHTWLTFTMPDSSSIEYGSVNTTNVDSAHRIRIIDKQDGTQEILLIAYRGILRINADLSVVETRRVYSTYNNSLIRDALIDSRGRYWITSEAGLEKGTSFVSTTYVSIEFGTDPDAPKTPISRIMEDSVGNIWFVSDFYGGDGFYCYTSEGQWTKYADGAVSDFGSRAHDIAAGLDGTVWFGSVYSGAGAILRYSPDNGGQWTRYTQANLGLQSGEIPSMAFDAAGGLWFTTAYTPEYVGNGTGVHYLTFSGDQPNVTHFTYRESSTTLATLRFHYIAADKSGNVWFPSYDGPSIARLNADGTWQQFRQAGDGSFGSGGFHGVAVDSKNIVYFAPVNKPPVAYDVTKEQWIELPAINFADYYYYGVYVDPQGGKWFPGAYFIYYLDSDNTAWTSISADSIPGFPSSEFTEGVLVDDAQNVWFMARYGVFLRKRDPEGGSPTWFKFSNGDPSGYSGGYRVYQDDSGQVWNAGKQKYNATDNTWITVTDTNAYDHRKLRFLNGTVPVDINLSETIEPIVIIDNYSGARTYSIDERNMTVDSRGTIYFTGGLGDTRAGIVAFGAPSGDLDGNGSVDLGDAILAAGIMADKTIQVSAGKDVSGDLKIGIAEMIFVLQRISGLR